MKFLTTKQVYTGTLVQWICMYLYINAGAQFFFTNVVFTVEDEAHFVHLEQSVLMAVAQQCSTSSTCWRNRGKAGYSLLRRMIEERKCGSLRASLIPLICFWPTIIPVIFTDDCVRFVGVFLPKFCYLGFSIFWRWHLNTVPVILSVLQ